MLAARNSAPRQLPPDLFRPRHHKVHNPSRQHALDPDLLPIPPPPAPRPPSPPLPIPLPTPRTRLLLPARPLPNRAPLPTPARPRPPPGLPPQIARDPDLEAPADTRRGADHRPRYHRPLFVLEDGERELGGGPAYALEGEEADERGEGRVVQAPAREETGGEREALVAC